MPLYTCNVFAVTCLYLAIFCLNTYKDIPIKVTFIGITSISYSG
ncbi:uncharacterized protein FFFS_10632 [Fusarium fujikuroi]|nr:uncharacterized protein FFFS_10632 [Fusarium fujikuroi]